jgi:hypothetical protein
MPGERFMTASIIDYLKFAREFDERFPGFESDVHGLRFEPGPAATGAGWWIACSSNSAKEAAMTPYPVKGSSLPIPFHRLMKVVLIADLGTRRCSSCVEHLRGETLSRWRQPPAATATSPRTRRSAPTSRWSTASGASRPRLARRVRGRRLPHPLWALADSHRITDMAVLT